MGLEIDHVVFRVDDLDAAGEALEGRLGLTSVAGGRHPGWGTANRIVPLGASYLELVAVVDRDEAAGNPFGKWVAGSPSGAPLGWVVRTNDLDGVARRLGLAIGDGSRATPDGGRLTWRSTGLIQAAADPCLPFFIEWGPGSRHPGAAPVAHPAGAVMISRLRLRGDRDRLAAWLGGDDLAVEVPEGAPGVLGVEVMTGAGPAILECI